MSGSMPKIDQNTISEAPIPFPEQRWIVAEIEQQFTRLDAGVAALRRSQAILERFQAAFLKAALEDCLAPAEIDLRRLGSQKVAGSSPVGRPILIARKLRKIRVLVTTVSANTATKIHGRSCVSASS